METEFQDLEQLVAALEDPEAWANLLFADRARYYALGRRLTQVEENVRRLAMDHNALMAEIQMPPDTS